MTRVQDARAARGVFASIAALALSGCTGALSALDPAGPAAQSVAHVWWWMLGGATLVLFGVLLLAGLAFRRPDGQRLSSGGAWRMIVAGGVVLPSVVIVALLIYGLPAGQSMRAGASDAYVVDVRAHQWWWEVIYPDGERSPLASASEIHIPAGRPVTLNISSADVIHSFWIPRLGGKIDAIPGRTNRLHLFVDEPGAYAGVCAEFCGAQHARMRMTIVAHDPDELARRRALLAQVHPARDRLLQNADFARQCLACHALDPRAPASDAPFAGPNLAGLSSRATLGSGLLPNTPENLDIWLREHQHLKPGNHMPHVDLSSAQWEAITALLGERHD